MLAGKCGLQQCTLGGVPRDGTMCVVQVFEFLSTDLKKYMDRNGKGPTNPLPPEMVKVCVVGG